MGLVISRLYKLFTEFGTTENRILLLGLDAAGKTTILYKVKLNEVVTTIPTIGFNVETVTPVKGVTFTVWDIGGQEKLRGLWRHYFHNTDGLIYVVDSSDRERVTESRDELHSMLAEDEMRNVPVVVIANKQDLPNALPPAQIIEGLQLNTLDLKHKWHVQGACAMTGDGVYEAMHAIARLVKESKAK